jgi:nucleoside-diphosphate-sugar epimerase
MPHGFCRRIEFSMQPNSIGPTNAAKSFWHGKRVLVTGASGFLGGHLLAALKGCSDLTALSRIERNSDGVHWYKVNLGDFEAVKQIFCRTRPQIIFHMSSLANGSRNIELVRPIFEAEVISTLNVLLAADASSVERIVLAGSLEEPHGSDAPNSPYAAAKASSRHYARMFHLLYGRPVLMTRLFMSYGERQPAYKIIPYALSALRCGESPKIASPGRLVDWIYAPDAIDGLLAAAAAPNLEGMSLDIGSGELHPISEVVEILRAIVAPTVPLHPGALAPSVREQVSKADADTTERLTGWRARTSLENGLRLTAELWSTPDSSIN